MCCRVVRPNYCSSRGTTSDDGENGHDHDPVSREREKKRITLIQCIWQYLVIVGRILGFAVSGTHCRPSSCKLPNAWRAQPTSSLQSLRRRLVFVTAEQKFQAADRERVLFISDAGCYSTGSAWHVITVARSSKRGACMAGRGAGRGGLHFADREHRRKEQQDRRLRSSTKSASIADSQYSCHAIHSFF